MGKISFSIYCITIFYCCPALSHIAPTQTITTPCGPVLPLLPLRRKVHSLAGLSTLYLSSAYCLHCLPGQRHPRGSQWSKWRAKRVWCIQVTCLSHVRCLCRKMLISGTWLASIYTWIKVVLKPTFSRKPYVKIWICILQLQRCKK